MAGTNGPGVFKMAAVGRPFRLGMLYDCHTDKLVPGVRLWDDNYMKKDLVVEPQNLPIHSEIFTEDTIERKTSVLGIHTNLKLSYMSGLLEISDIGKYLDNHLLSSKLERTTLYYRNRAKLECLKMSCLSKDNLLDSDILSTGVATHVVTGIMYGAELLFVFDRDIESDKSSMPNFNLQEMIDQIRRATTETDSAFCAESTNMVPLKIHVYSNIPIPSSVKSYIDVVQVWKNLPGYLAKEDILAPVEVWLYPLRNLDFQLSESEPSVIFVSCIQNVLEHFHILIRKCRDLTRGLACKKFAGLAKDMNKFSELIISFKEEFQKALATIIPRIRSGKTNDEALKTLLEQKNKSPFSEKDLSTWLDYKCAEARTLEHFIQTTTGIDFARQESALGEATFWKSTGIIYCFTVRRPATDPFLTNMTSYLENKGDYKKKKMSDEGVYKFVDDVTTRETLVTNYETFCELYARKKADGSTKFIIREELNDNDDPGGFIYVYKKGELVNKNYNLRSVTSTETNSNINGSQFPSMPHKYPSSISPAVMSQKEYGYPLSSALPMKLQSYQGNSRGTKIPLTQQRVSEQTIYQTPYQTRMPGEILKKVTDVEQVNNKSDTARQSRGQRYQEIQLTSDQQKESTRKTNQSNQLYFQPYKGVLCLENQKVADNQAYLNIRSQAAGTETERVRDQKGCGLSQLQVKSNECVDKMTNQEQQKYSMSIANGNKTQLVTNMQGKKSSSQNRTTCSPNTFTDESGCRNEPRLIDSDKYTEPSASTQQGEGRTENTHYESYKVTNVINMVHVTHNQMTVSWQRPLYDDYSNREYEVCICQNEKLVLRQRSHSEMANILKLQPGTSYNIQVYQIIGNVARLHAAHTHATLPSSPPGQPKVHMISPHRARVEWIEPKVIGKPINIYEILCKTKYDEKWFVIKTVQSNRKIADIAIKGNVACRFKVIANCEPFGRSYESPESEEFCNKPEGYSTKMLIRLQSELLSKDTPEVYKVAVSETYVDGSRNIRTCELGQQSERTRSGKVIMLVGATGSGKTTLINGMTNFIFGIEWEDDYRFKLICESSEGNQAISQTNWVTAYTFHHHSDYAIPYTLTVIDTPGFGDTRGISRDKEITTQIKTLFTMDGPARIDHLDAIGFVVQASLPRFTPSQKYIFDSILALFGKNITENIFMLLTFSDGQEPPVFSALQKAEIPYQNFFRFNNSALYATNAETSSKSNALSFDAMFWKMGNKSFRLFLDSLICVSARSLVLTRDVLSERGQLETYIQGIQTNIQLGLNKREQLEEEMQILKGHQSDFDMNKDFEYVIEIECVYVEPIAPGTYTSNCIVCKRTCHYPCAFKDNSDRINCSAMVDGHCSVCPGKCSWKEHQHLPHKYKIGRQKVKKTANKLKERYEVSKGQKFNSLRIIKEIEAEIKFVETEILNELDKVTSSLNRLDEIALKPGRLSTIEYIDILVQSEQSEANPGWMKRVKQLQDLKLKLE